MSYSNKTVHLVIPFLIFGHEYIFTQQSFLRWISFALVLFPIKLALQGFVEQHTAITIKDDGIDNDPLLLNSCLLRTKYRDIL